MERMPYRAAQANRPATSRPASHPEAKPATTPPEASTRTSGSQHHGSKKEKQSKNKLVTIVACIVVALLILAAGWFVFTKFIGSSTQIEADKYQFIKLANNEEYYGKLSIIDNDTLMLTDIFYIKPQETAKDDATKDKEASDAQNQNNLQLIKLGSEVHGPEDKMIITRSQVLFYMNLKPDGKVSQTIGQYKP